MKRCNLRIPAPFEKWAGRRQFEAALAANGGRVLNALEAHPPAPGASLRGCQSGLGRGAGRCGAAGHCCFGRPDFRPREFILWAKIERPRSAGVCSAACLLAGSGHPAYFSRSPFSGACAPPPPGQPAAGKAPVRGSQSALISYKRLSEPNSAFFGEITHFGPPAADPQGRRAFEPPARSRGIPKRRGRQKPAPS